MEQDTQEIFEKTKLLEELPEEQEVVSLFRYETIV